MITIKNGNDFPSNVFQNAIEQIHASVNWSHYNHNIGQKNTLVAVLDEKIVGYVSAFSGYIPFIAVNKEFQDRKIGQVLMSGVVDKCRTLGIKTLELDFRANNPKTKAFYENFAAKNNLRYDSRPQGHYSNNDPRLHVTMTLPEIATTLPDSTLQPTTGAN